MVVLNQTVLATLESPSGIYNINNEDYTLNGATLAIPAGKTLRFSNGGTINNGTLQLSNNLLDGLANGSINARITGTIQNTVLYTTQISGIDNLGLTDYSGITVYCNQNDVVNHTIILNNINASNPAIFDGLNNSFTCNVTFFQILGQSNITIRNFIANANAADIVFEEMVTTSSNVTNVNVNDNTIADFKMGISLNNDSADYTVSYSNVKGNHISNCTGSTPGNGYGIHMANARHCMVSGNEVVNCERHAIYLAYGEDNIIKENYIRNHCQNIVTYNLLAALEIGRKSKNIDVNNNTFENCNNVCLLVYSPLPSDDADGSSHLWRYGKCEGITICDNCFARDNNLTGSIGNLPYIYIGVEGTAYPPLMTSGRGVADVEILDNTFQMPGGENQKCIRVNQCEELTISGNSFQLGLSSSPQSNEYLVIDIPVNHIAGYISNIEIYQNTFSYVTTGIGNLYLIGENMSLINSSNSPFYTISWYNNTLQNQVIGGNTMYQLSKYALGNNFSYIP